MVEIMKIMATSFNRSHAHTAALSAPGPEGGHGQPTPGHSQASLGQSLVGSLLLSPGSWSHKFLFVLDWMKHKLESRLQGEISITSGVQMTPPLWHPYGEEQLKSLLMKVKEEREKLA